MAAGGILAALMAVLVGTLVLAEVGPHVQDRRAMTAHILLAIAGVAVLGVGAFGAGAPLVWASLGALVVAGALGLRTFVRTTRSGGVAVIVVAHGLIAALTLVLVAGLALSR